MGCTVPYIAHVKWSSYFELWTIRIDLRLLYIDTRCYVLLNGRYLIPYIVLFKYLYMSYFIQFILTTSINELIHSVASITLTCMSNTYTHHQDVHHFEYSLLVAAFVYLPLFLFALPNIIWSVVQHIVHRCILWPVWQYSRYIRG